MTELDRQAAAWRAKQDKYHADLQAWIDDFLAPGCPSPQQVFPDFKPFEPKAPDNPTDIRSGYHFYCLHFHCLTTGNIALRKRDMDGLKALFKELAAEGWNMPDLTDYTTLNILAYEMPDFYITNKNKTFRVSITKQVNPNFWIDLKQNNHATK